MQYDYYTVNVFSDEAAGFDRIDLRFEKYDDAALAVDLLRQGNKLINIRFSGVTEAGHGQTLKLLLYKDLA